MSANHPAEHGINSDVIVANRFQPEADLFVAVSTLLESDWSPGPIPKMAQ